MLVRFVPCFEAIWPLPGQGLVPSARLWLALSLVLGLLWAGPAHGQVVVPDSAASPANGNKERPGSAPMPPVRYISPDPRDPMGPPTPGTANPGRHVIPAPSRKPAPGAVGAAARDSSGAVGGVGGTGDSLMVKARRKGQVETTVKYAASDSIQFDVEQKVARLYNKAVVDYGEMNLKAALITVNYGTNTMMAEGRQDTVKHRLDQRPVFKDQDGLYTAGKIAYNFKTKKGKIAEAVTTQGEGYVSAETIKKMPGNELYGLRGRYTTCNLEHPHFYIQASKMKVIPGEKVVTGPFNLVIGDVPTPLGFLFGFFPSPNKGRGSGVLIPTFGQAANRGYFLSNGGYYFAPNDYIGVRLTGDVYAGNGQYFGGWGATADVQYLKRYTYNGGFNLRFTSQPISPLVPPTGTNTNPEFLRPYAAQTVEVSWNHTPVARPGGGRFSASVHAGSRGFNRVQNTDVRSFLTPAFSSSINYSKTIRNSPVNYTVQLNQSQNTQTGAMDFILPNVSVGVARQYPYQWLGVEPLGRFYEQFSISYNLLAQNQVSNTVAGRSLSGGLPLLGGSMDSRVVPFSLDNIGSLFRDARSGMQHQFGIALGSYTVAKHLQVSPSVSYSENWYFQRLNYRYVPAAQAIRVDTARGFYREFGYAAGASLNTTFYGTAIIKGKKIEAIRHKVTPSLNYSFSPDLITENDNLFSTVVLPRSPNTPGQQEPVRFSRYQGALYAPPGGNLSSALSFTLQNSVEMKVRDNEDTTGTTPFKKVSLIDGLDFAISYDFAADSQKLSDLQVNFRRQVGQHLSLNSTASFSPYQRDSTGRELNRYLWAADSRRLARLVGAGFQLNYSFNPASGKKKSAVPREVAPSNDPTLGTPGQRAFYADYVDFDIPWELSMNYTASYQTAAVPLRSGQMRPPLLATSSVGLTGSIKLTENLRLNSQLNYDFVSSTVVYPTIAFFRDLHCWQISGMWIPLGQTRGYNFTIAAKSSLLQDLKLNRNRLTQYQ